MTGESAQAERVEQNAVDCGAEPDVVHGDTPSHKPLRLLLVGLNYAPEPVGIGPYTTGLAEALATRGHAVSVVAGRPYYPQWRTYPGYERSGWRGSVENGVTIRRCPHYVPARPDGARRVLHHLSFAASALVPALIAARRHRPNIVLCVVPSLLSVPVARVAAWLCGARLWLHVQDFEVEAAFATGLVSGQGAAARFARAVEGRLLRLADRISTISPQMAARLPGKGVPTSKVRELRNWATFPADPSGNGAGYREEWQLGDASVALYSGNIANKQGIEVVIDAARRLAARRDIMFVICGEGPNRARLEQRAAGLGNVRFHDLQPAARMPELLALASVHLLPQIAEAAELVLPSKLTNMLASARPVVATAAAGTALAGEVEGCGVVVPPGDDAALAAAVAALIDDPERARVLGSAAGRRAEQRWSHGAITRCWADELAAL